MLIGGHINSSKYCAFGYLFMCGKPVKGQVSSTLRATTSVYGVLGTSLSQMGLIKFNQHHYLTHYPPLLLPRSIRLVL